MTPSQAANLTVGQFVIYQGYLRRITRLERYRAGQVLWALDGLSEQLIDPQDVELSH